MRIDQVKRTNPNRASRQVGRGGKRGKTSGRGTKGQKARAGHRMRPEWRDIIKRIPKQRGYRFSPVSEKPEVVKLVDLERAFSSGDTVTPMTLIDKKVVKKSGGKVPSVKILASGALTKKLAVSGCAVSEAAQAAIKKAGGSVSA